MYNKIILPLVLTFSWILVLSCSESKISGEKGTFPKINDIPNEQWVKLSQKKIFFAHKSVGYNIMEGVKDVLKENPEIKLNIVETSEASDLKIGVFAHSTVGKNAAPQTKIVGFTNIMNNGTGEKADYVALKFCWADMMANTDIDQIFSNYNESITQLKRKYPDITIIHFTVPLTTNQTGPRTWLKKLMGKPVWGIEENVKRNKYNEMLIEKYKGIDPIFDIANIESTYPDGRHSKFEKDGKIYRIMVPEYTYDHGHLNEHGRRIVGEQLLIFLANIS